jgi:glutathione S-transferase
MSFTVAPNRKLYYSSGSPYARTIRILLHELGLEYDSNRIDRLRTVEEIASVNPALAIPVLEDRGRILFDTKVIAAWLLDNHRPPTGVALPFTGVLAREEAKWDDLEINAALETLSETMVSLYLYGRDANAAGIDIEEWPYTCRQRDRMERILDWLAPRFTPDGRAPGVFTFQDVVLISICEFTDLRGIHPMSGRPSLDGVRAYFAQRPSILATVPV